MLDSLPSRPLSQSEVDAFSESDAIDLTFPGSPESIRENDDGQQRVHDLLLFIGETVVAIAYDETDASWIVISKESDEDDDAYEVAYDELLAYQGYEDLDREEAMKQAVMKLYGLPEDVIEGDLTQLESLDEI
jgi:hypothetical protein